MTSTSPGGHHGGYSSGRGDVAGRGRRRSGAPTPGARDAGRNLARPAALLTTLLAIAGCDQALTIPARFPEPLVVELPLRVGVHYPPEFRNYEYTEKLSGSTTWTIRNGAANVALFDSVFQRLFREVAVLDALPQAGQGAGYDAYIQPSVAAFEFAVPDQSGTNQYSVWIRYTLRVLGPDGTLITEWPVSAYGQSDSDRLKPARSMEAATLLAMRDAAASVAVNFGARKEIRKSVLRERLLNPPGTEPDARPAVEPRVAPEAEPPENADVGAGTRPDRQADPAVPSPES